MVKSSCYSWISLAGLLTTCLWLAPCLLWGSPPEYVPAEFPHETYTQKIIITFSSESDARQASVQILPLFNGYDWAFSSRWDDNNKHHLETRDLLLKRGCRGTWYLNDPNGFEEIGLQLLQDGFSIGGHTMIHPYLPFINRNRMFYELAAVRACWEAALDTQVLSHSFSFCNFRSAIEPDTVQVDIDRVLQRAGYYHLATHVYYEYMKSDIIPTGLLPPDGEDIDPFIQKALQDPQFHEQIPNLSLSMHSWIYRADDPAKTQAIFEGQLDKYSGNADWWYCNQNQYAAYRYQFLHSTLSDFTRDGHVLTFTIVRPCLLDLNDATPLSMEIWGVSPDKIKSVQCPAADLTVSDRKTPAYLFHLAHDRDQKLPEKTGIIINDDNHQTMMENDSDSDFPMLFSLLAFDRNEGKLNLSLKNQTDAPLENVRITFRLPLAWKEGINRVKVDLPIPVGDEQQVISFTPTLQHDDYKYLAGVACFVAQIDFQQSNRPGRIHTLCFAKNDLNDDPSYPQGRFLVMGPVKKELLDTPKWIEQMDSHPAEQSSSWQFVDGSTLTWLRDPLDTAFEKPFFDVESIRARILGEKRISLDRYWYSDHPHVYLLQSCVVSSDDQPVVFVCGEETRLQGLYLNGQKIENVAGQLKKGNNTLQLIFDAQTQRGWNRNASCCSLRLIDPQTGSRLTNICYEPDRLTMNAKSFYRPPIQSPNDQNFQ